MTVSSMANGCDVTKSDVTGIDATGIRRPKVGDFPYRSSTRRRIYRVRTSLNILPHSSMRRTYVTRLLENPVGATGIVQINATSTYSQSQAWINTEWPSIGWLRDFGGSKEERAITHALLESTSPQASMTGNDVTWSHVTGSDVITGNYGRRSFSKYGKHSNRNYSAILATLRVVALPRHKFVTGATLLQLINTKH
jgi:hypothetical protein